MRTIRNLTAVAFALTVLMSLGAMTAAAAPPNAGEPLQVAYLDNASHTIAANSSQLFRFDYALKDDGTRPMTSMRLVNGTYSGVDFGVWTADQLNALAITDADARADMINNQPIGRGTSANVVCDSGVLSSAGECKAADLTWVGAFGSGGPYYVKITNDNAFSSEYQLIIQGSGVGLAPKIQVASAMPMAVPAAAPALVAIGSDPTQAVVMDGQLHSIASRGATWYRLDYAINDDGTRPVVTLRLLNGTKSGVDFQLWTADQLHAQAKTFEDAQADMFNNRPFGRGTAANVNCDSGVLDASASCKSSDLVWKGALGATGLYYVQIVNANDFESDYQLVMSID